KPVHLLRNSSFQCLDPFRTQVVALTVQHMGLKQRRRPRARQPAEAQHAASPASNYQARVTPIRHISIPKAQRIALYPLGDTPALSSNLIANNRLTLLNELLNLGLVFNDADEGAKGYISHSLPKFVD